jgi:putative ABC transport system ATP-binding protein
MTLSASVLLTLRNVSHGYREAGVWREVLRGVDLEVKSGEQVALVGQSGSGKSTLMHLMGALDRPKSGRILFEETDLAVMGEPQRTLWRRQHVGFIYQFFNLIPTLTVIENVLLPLELNGTPETRSDWPTAPAAILIGFPVASSNGLPSFAH